MFSLNEIRFLTKKHQTAVHEGIVKMSQKKQNLILTSLQIRKKYQCPLRRVAVRFSSCAVGQMLNFLRLDSRIVKASTH